MRTSAVLRPPGITVNFEVETFKIFGKLRKTETEVHNSLPTLETIQTEKSLLSFEEKRRQSPDNADYGHFYRSLMSSITPAPSSRAPSAITFGRRANVTRGDDSRVVKFTDAMTGCS
nr:hypothetical protein BaRGS_016858 [Batillaria attramentaria]